MKKILYFITKFKIFILCLKSLLRNQPGEYNYLIYDKNKAPPLRTCQLRYIKGYKYIRAMYRQKFFAKNNHGIAEIIEISTLDCLSTPPDDLKLFKSKLLNLIDVCSQAYYCVEKLEKNK